MKNYMKSAFSAVLIVFLFTISTLAEARKDRPVIGISASKPAAATINYIKAVRIAGGVPLIIPITGDEAELAVILKNLDGVILTGGEDVEPARYGETPHPCLGKVYLERDDFDIKLIRMAVRKGLPVLGICRGSQVMNVAFGGTLYQDIPSEFPDSQIKHRSSDNNVEKHAIKLTEGTKLHRLLGESVSVNTMHHQAVKDVAPGFVIAAVSEDGVVEAIEKTGAPCVIGVQFHPEVFVANGNNSLLPIFTHFIKTASK